ncbi:MAG TPA: helix-turn-helix domain-containing protein [Ignavibacteria bacterium]|nr:helix-turn-helix domain-containing protein [Ignavibacteria bacterium]
MKKKSIDINQKDIAKAIGCSRQYLSSVINGKEKSLLANFVFKEYLELDVTINFVKLMLLDGTEDLINYTLESRKNLAAKEVAFELKRMRDKFLKNLIEGNIEDKINKVLFEKSKVIKNG